jgi:putative transcriptional regulator
MGEHKVRLADVARATGINRGTLSRLYQENTARIDIDVLEALCSYFQCGVHALLEYVPGDDSMVRLPNRRVGARTVGD